MKNILVGCLLASMAFSANASFVDSSDGTYLSDEATGLDWLDVTTTANKSYNYVNMQFGDGGLYEGFRYATTDEFSLLVSSNTGVTPGDDVYAYHTSAAEETDALVMALGSTLDTLYMENHGKTWDEFYNFDEGEGFDYTYGMLYSADVYGIREAHIVDQEICCGDDRSAYSGPSFDKRFYSFQLGSYLVRETASVPEPATLALFGLGLAGIGFGRKRKLTA
jgi:hypothetical protein